VEARIANVLRGIKQRWEPSFLKRRRSDREYASGKWDHCDDTRGAWVYQFVEKYSAGGSILDLGCGAGNTGNELKADSYDHYTGVDVSAVAVERAIERTARSGRAAKNDYTQSDFLSYAPTRRYDVILFRESIYHVPEGLMKATLDRYARALTSDGVFIAYLSRDGTRHVRAIVAWIEANYRVISKHWREAPAPDAAAYRGDAFILVFR
jgi:SAM-dependent methyltransferase